MFSLQGKVALVTGAARGMGAGIARALAQQGAKVVVNDINEELADTLVKDLIRQGYCARSANVSVTDQEAVCLMVADIEAHWGAIDILVNNVGIPCDGLIPTPFRETDESDWDRLFDLNLKSTLYCTHAVLGGMCCRGFGRIINIISEAWCSTAGHGIAAYASAKGGVLAFSNQLAGEVGKQGVTVNCVSLGLMENIPNAHNDALRFPIPRPGSAQDAGAACAFLASEEAGWITAHSLVVNGGMFAH